MRHRHISLKALSLLLGVLLLAMPILAQQQDAANQARMDAERNVGKGTWILLGVFLGLIGYIIALASPPSAPAYALVGKSPEYVATYSEVYRDVGRKRQMSGALTGCLIGLGIQVVLIVLLVVIANNDSDLDYYY